MAAIWVRIRLDDGGPVLYRGMRAGRGGTPFEMYKFRTMVVNAERLGGSSTADDDPRITRTGRALRRFKLDELPQLFNVLKGDMSLVGPRPQVLHEVAEYTEEERHLLDVRPGVTDWASLRFNNEGEILRGHADADKAYAEIIKPEKVRLGLEYVRQATLSDDLRILWQTATLPFRRNNADFVSVTETWGSLASPEQVEMSYFRYHLVGDLAAGKRVLEVGCGTGMGLAYLAERAHEAVGCDVSEALLAQARAHLPGIALLQAEAGKLPFEPNSFDVVAMLEMIYYVPNQSAAITDCARLLKSGGSLVVCLPNRDRPAFNPSPHSTNYPNVPELAQLFRGSGLDATIYGAFAVEPEGARDRVMGGVRAVAVKFHLIPRSMRGKAILKRLLYGRLPRMGAIHDGMAAIPAEVELNPAVPTSTYKNVYAFGRKP